jgi:hypothetical protein
MTADEKRNRKERREGTESNWRSEMARKNEKDI